MTRAFEAKPARPSAPGASPRPAAPTHAMPPAANFAQLANRLHLGTPEQRHAAAYSGRDFSGITGPGRPPVSGGLPAGLRADVEARSGLPMDDVRVHRNSPKPRTLGALAYAQGRDIHLGPGQEKHLAHEAWHVVQQKQGRVRPTGRIAGLPVNDEVGLEREAEATGRGPASSRMQAKEGGASPGRRGGQRQEDAAIQLYRPLGSDHGRLFLIRRHADDAGSIGEYVHEQQRASGEGYLFRTRAGMIRLGEDDIVGYRPVVGLSHPPDQVRPPSERLEGRSQVFLSEADMSGIHARMRKDMTLARSAVATAYESSQTLEGLYPSYKENLGHIERQGIPVVHEVDLSNVNDSVERLQNLSPLNRHLHFQMPRVPRTVKNYSTQKLISDTNDVAAGLNSASSFVLPGPESYSKAGTHNRIYGMQHYTIGNPTPNNTNMKYTGAIQDPDQDLEKYGYVHKQTTKNQSADVVDKRMRYEFTYSPPSEHESEKDKLLHKRRDDRDPGSGGGGDGIMT